MDESYRCGHYAADLPKPAAPPHRPNVINCNATLRTVQTAQNNLAVSCNGYFQPCKQVCIRVLLYVVLYSKLFKKTAVNVYIFEDSMRDNSGK